MSNNPPLPPPDMDDFEATMIREQNPPPELTREDAKPRRAKTRNPIWGYIALGGWFALAGLIGAFLGTLLANLL